MQVVLLLVIGLVAGLLGGMFGIGGGLIMVPALLYVMKVDLLTANGTSLAAQVLPVGLLGAWEYYRGGHAKIYWALFIAAGFFVGAYFGAKVVLGSGLVWAKRGYAVFLLVIAIQMLLTE